MIQSQEQLQHLIKQQEEEIENLKCEIYLRKMANDKLWQDNRMLKNVLDSFHKKFK